MFSSSYCLTVSKHLQLKAKTCNVLPSYQYLQWITETEISRSFILSLSVMSDFKADSYDSLLDIFIKGKQHKWDQLLIYSCSQNLNSTCNTPTLSHLYLPKPRSATRSNSPENIFICCLSPCYLSPSSFAFCFQIPPEQIKQSRYLC